MKKRMYAKFLAGLLCAAMLSADLMSADFFALAAEAENAQEVETQTQEDAEAQEESFENVSSILETETPAESAQTQDSEAMEQDTEVDSENPMQGEAMPESTEAVETETTETEAEYLFESEVQETETQIVLNANRNIASGVIDEDYGHITWVIDADGKLTVTGTGDFSNSKYTGSFDRAPWYTYAEAIKSAKINVTGMTDASNMFLCCSDMVSIDMSSFDTSNVTDMALMFDDCRSLSSLDLSNFDTSNVTDMSGMFIGCYSLSSLDLSNFDTSNVTNMESMFSECFTLSNLNLSSFDTSNITNMGNMFSGCSALNNLNLSGFNTSNVTNMRDMFAGCSALSNLNLSGFNTSNVVDMDSMFIGCSSLNNLNLTNFDTSKVTSMHGMFWGCSSLDALDLSKFNTSNVTYMSGMFYDCSSLDALDLSKFNTTNVVSMNSMFSDCRLLNSLDLSNFYTSNITDMTYMFADCRTLNNLNLENFNTSKVVEMYGMFYNCRSLSNLNLHNFNTSKVTTMGSMFAYCPALISLNIDSFNTSNVTDMSDMFEYCSSLNTLNLNNFNTSNVTKMDCMFNGCSSLSNLNLSSFNTSNVSDMQDIFKDCDNLSTIYTPCNLKLSVTLPTSTSTDKWYHSNGTIVMELPQNLSYSETLGKNYIPKGEEPERSLTVSFDTQGGEALAPITGIAFGSTISLPDNVTRAGYVFEGWYTQPVGGVKIEGGSFTVTETTTLYAHWSLADEDIDTENQGDGLWISGVAKAGYTYTGDAIIPAVTVWDKSTPLVEKIDYTIAYKNNVNVGKATITVTGKGNYSGRETFSFDITPADIESDVYADSFYVKTNAKKAQKPVPELYYMGSKLKNNKDFTVTYSNTSGIYAQEGEYSVTVTGKNNFTGTRALTLTAVTQIPKKQPISITKAALTGFEESFTYTGKAYTQTCTLKMQTDSGEKTLVEGADYTVRYANNKKAGTASVTYYGKNRYSGKLKKTYKILPYDIVKDEAQQITYTKTIECVYAKGGAKPKPLITFDGKALREGTDYTLSYKGNKTIGSGSSPCVTINGKGNFKGRIAVDFTTTPQDLSKMTLVSCDKVYSGKAGAHKLTPKLMDLDGKLLSAGKDFDKNSITYTYEKDTSLTDGVLRKAGEPVADTDILPADTQIRVAINHGSGNGYTGTFTGVYRIVKADLKSAKVEIPTQTYTGSAIVPDKQRIKVTLAGVSLHDEDYDIVLCTDNVKKGKASITIQGKGNYGGTKTVKFTIGARGFLWWWRKG